MVPCVSVAVSLWLLPSCVWGWHRLAPGTAGCPCLVFVREGAKKGEISHSSWPRHCAGTWSCFSPVPCSSPKHLSSQLWLCLSRGVFLLLSQWATLPLLLCCGHHSSVLDGFTPRESIFSASWKSELLYLKKLFIETLNYKSSSSNTSILGKHKQA